MSVNGSRIVIYIYIYMCWESVQLMGRRLLYHAAYKRVMICLEGSQHRMSAGPGQQNVRLSSVCTAGTGQTLYAIYSPRIKGCVTEELLQLSTSMPCASCSNLMVMCRCFAGSLAVPCCRAPSRTAVSCTLWMFNTLPCPMKSCTEYGKASQRSSRCCFCSRICTGVPHHQCDG